MEKVMKSAAQNAATLAWTAPIIAFIFNFMARNIPNPSTVTNSIVLGISLLLYVTGLAAGIMAFKKRAPQEPRVVTPAIVGIVISGLSLLLVGSVVVANL